jgi:alkylation response protein AidB-like acyl-CoA dehydrogenase
MDFELDEERELLRRSAREFLERRFPLTRLREIEKSPQGYDPELWREMIALDWSGLGLPESLGGADAGFLSQYALHLELGRALVPSPLLSSSALAGNLLLACGAEAHADLLARIASGAAIVAPAIDEADGDFGLDSIQLRAARDTGGWRLSGTKLFVPFAHVAERVLIAARTAPGPDGVTLFLLDPKAPGLRCEALPNIADLPLFALTLDGVRASDRELVGKPDCAGAALEAAWTRAGLLHCAEIVGAGERVLEMTLRYALDREQFGKPIGQYQAVQYLCSDIAIDVHLAALLSRQAAWRIDAGLAADYQAAVARAHAGVVAQRIVRQAHEVFAGAAFMLENDIQLFTRRAKHWELALGDARWHRDRLAGLLDGEASV